MNRKLARILNHYKSATWTDKPNSLKIPVTRFVYNDSDVDKFNRIYELIQQEKNFKQIVRTPSGGISFDITKDLKLSDLFYMWDIRQLNSTFEITIIDITEGMWRIQITNGRPANKLNAQVLSGRKAYFMFIAMLKRNNIDLKQYAIENGQQVHSEIEKPIISSPHELLYRNKTFTGVNHIDFRNSYPAGLVNTHPEFKPTIEYLYKHRNRNPEYKDILNFTIGFFHSKMVGWKYANLAKDAIKDSNDRVRELAARLEKAGCLILLFNTDGIWYKGEPYHGDGEGPDLGQWRNDHINCKFRFKSIGAYEFIENGRYFPVLRGYTKLDDIKPREAWEWGDIYRSDAEVKTYKFIEGEGILKNV